MRLTIGNLFIAGRMDKGTERSAGILARKPGKMNPPYTGRRVAAGAEYRIGDMKEARRAIRRSGQAKREPDPYRVNSRFGTLADTF
jgi:hypothetical protein